jgi:hypothetical protein
MAATNVALLASIGDGTQVILHEEGKNLLSSFDGPVVFVSVCGCPGSGKSTLCHFLTGRADTPSKTVAKDKHSGVWLYPTTLMDEDSGAQVALLDLQAVDGPKYDALFAFCAGISGLVLYNAPSLPTEELVIKLGNTARKIPGVLAGGNGGPVLPKLAWVARNTSSKQLDAEYEALKKNLTEAGGKDKKKTPKDAYGRTLLEQSLMPTQGFDDKTMEANQAKQILTSLFKLRDCLAIPKPSTDANVLANMEAAQASSLLESWHLAVNKLVEYVSRQNLNLIEETTFVGRALSGKLMCAFVEKFAASETQVAASAVWPEILQAHLSHAESEAFNVFQTALSDRVERENIDYMKKYLEAAPDEDDADEPETDANESTDGIDANVAEGQTQKLSSWLLKKMQIIGAKPEEKKKEGDSKNEDGKKSRFRWRRNKRGAKEGDGAPGAPAGSSAAGALSATAASVTGKVPSEKAQDKIVDKLQLPIDEVDLWGIYRECKQQALADFTGMCSGLGKDIEIDTQVLALKKAVICKFEIERALLFEINSQASHSYCQAILYRLHLSMTASCQLYRLSRSTGRPAKLIADKQGIDMSGVSNENGPAVDSTSLQSFLSLGYSDFHSKLQILVGVYRQTARGPAQASVLKEYLVSAVDDDGAADQESRRKNIMKGCVPRQLEDWGDALTVEHSKALLDVIMRTNEARIELTHFKVASQSALSLSCLVLFGLLWSLVASSCLVWSSLVLSSLVKSTPVMSGAVSCCVVLGTTGRLT